MAVRARGGGGSFGAASQLRETCLGVRGHGRKGLMRCLQGPACGCVKVSNCVAVRLWPRARGIKPRNSHLGSAGVPAPPGSLRQKGVAHVVLARRLLHKTGVIGGAHCVLWAMSCTGPFRASGAALPACLCKDVAGPADRQQPHADCLPAPLAWSLCCIGAANTRAPPPPPTPSHHHRPGQALTTAGIPQLRYLSHRPRSRISTRTGRAMKTCKWSCSPNSAKKAL